MPRIQSQLCGEPGKPRQNSNGRLTRFVSSLREEQKIATRITNRMVRRRNGPRGLTAGERDSRKTFASRSGTTKKGVKTSKETSMKLRTIGIDLGKTWFHRKRCSAPRY